MKIAFFLDDPYSYGGAGTLLLKQAKLMTNMHDVMVVIPTNEDGDENPRYSQYCDTAGLRHVGIEYKTAFHFRNIDLLKAIQDVPKLIAFLVEEKIEFIHSAQLNVAVELASRQLELPHLMNIYQLEREEFLFKQEDLYAHYHLCDSQKYSMQWEQGLRVKSKCLRPLTPITEKIEKVIEKKECYNIVMLGGLYERKNQLSAIRAIEQICHTADVKLIIAGNDETSYGKRCKEYVKEHHLENYVEFYGFVMDIDKVLSMGDWFLMTSIDESFPSSIVEAISYGLVLISTPVAGVPEVFSNHVNAFISEDFSVNAVVAAIEDCYNWCRSGDVVEIQKNASETWKDNFSQEVNLEKINNYYSEIITENKKFSRPKEMNDELLKEVKATADLIMDKCANGVQIATRAFYCNYLMKQLQTINKSKAYIWGAGMYGSIAQDFLSHLVPSIKILGFLDNYKEGFYLGYPIMKPKNVVIDEDTYIFISFGGDIWSVINNLKELGLKFSHNIWIFP